MFKQIRQDAKTEMNFRPPKKPKQKGVSYQTAKQQVKREQGRGPKCVKCNGLLKKHRPKNGRNYYTCPNHGYYGYVL